MIIDITLRLLIAMLLGGVIGIEREYRSKDAGFRTHFLVALGSALFCIVSQYGFGFDLKDSSRVAAQVVSGIGFLGAGTIIFQRNVVRGLTTAAGLWVTAAIGLACGSGMFAAAAIATVLIIVGLEVLILFIPHIGRTVVELSFSTSSEDNIKTVVNELKRVGIRISSYKLRKQISAQGGKVYRVDLELRVKRHDGQDALIDMVSGYEDVTISSVE
uniref:MgtC/SapB family protein n=1 Tax=Alloprevotella sp. TaxID=1872471 RepID=UPI003FEDBFCA